MKELIEKLEKLKELNREANFYGLNKIIDEAIQALSQSEGESNEQEIKLENILEQIKSDSVYTLLRKGVKNPSSTGVDDCEDSDYIDLYNLSVKLRANRFNTTQN